VKRKRPENLSDPGKDFSSWHLQDILAKPDCELIWSDFQDLFGPHLPAGTYEEIVYFLPFGFQYLVLPESESLDTVSAVFGFCSKNSFGLEKDGIKEQVDQAILGCLDFWTQCFEIVHLDEKACKRKGWKREYFDYVKNSELLFCGLKNLIELKTYEQMAISFLWKLGDHNGNAIKAAWFLESSRARLNVYGPPPHPDIDSLLCDKDLLKSAFEVVERKMISEIKASTYWMDVSLRLDL